MKQVRISLLSVSELPLTCFDGLYDPGVLLCLNEQTLAVIPKAKLAKLRKKTSMTWQPPVSQVFYINPETDILVITALEIFDDGVQIPVGNCFAKICDVAFTRDREAIQKFELKSFEGKSFVEVKFEALDYEPTVRAESSPSHSQLGGGSGSQTGGSGGSGLGPSLLPQGGFGSTMAPVTQAGEQLKHHARTLSKTIPKAIKMRSPREHYATMPSMNFEKSGPHELDFDDDFGPDVTLGSSNGGSSSSHRHSPLHSGHHHSANTQPRDHFQVSNAPPNSSASRLSPLNLRAPQQSGHSNRKTYTTGTSRNQHVSSEVHDDSLFAPTSNLQHSTNNNGSASSNSSGSASHSTTAPSNNTAPSMTIDWTEKRPPQLVNPLGDSSTSASHSLSATPTTAGSSTSKPYSPPLPTVSKTLAHSHPSSSATSHHHSSKRADLSHKNAIHDLQSHQLQLNMQSPTSHQQPTTPSTVQQPTTGKPKKTPVPPSIHSSTTSQNSPTLPKFTRAPTDNNTSSIAGSSNVFTKQPAEISFESSASQQKSPIHLQISHQPIPVSQPSPQPSPQAPFGNNNNASAMPNNPFNNVSSPSPSLLVNNAGSNIFLAQHNNTQPQVKPATTSFADLTAPLSKSNPEISRPTNNNNNIFNNNQNTPSNPTSNFGISQPASSGSSSATSSEASSLQFLAWQPTPNPSNPHTEMAWQELQFGRQSNHSSPSVTPLNQSLSQPISPHTPTTLPPPITHPVLQNLQQPSSHPSRARALSLGVPPVIKSTGQKPNVTQYQPKEIVRDHPHIAKGSYGIVYTGRVPDVNDLVVIKDMDLVNQSSIEEWKRELTVMSENSSNYICRVYGYSSVPKILTIVMEYMKLGDLFHILENPKEHPLSVIQKMRMARHISLGIYQLHHNGFMHRDIKSMNVLVTEDYSCKLADFGTAKISGETSWQNTANAGTPLWMAPEVKSGAYGLPADIYSFGLVLFEIFSGVLLPYWNPSTQHLTLPYVFNSSPLVLPCINRDPSLRPSSLQVSQHLDWLLNKILLTCKAFLSTMEQEQLREATLHVIGPETQQEKEMMLLYKHYLKKPAYMVDQMLGNVFLLK